MTIFQELNFPLPARKSLNNRGRGFFWQAAENIRPSHKLTAPLRRTGPGIAILFDALIVGNDVGDAELSKAGSDRRLRGPAAPR
jgi:hypothetical protein